MKTIGVRLDIHPSDNLFGQIKQELLLFDKIGVVDLSRQLQTYEELNSFPDEFAFFSNLINNNYLFDISHEDLYDSSFNKDFEIFKASLERLAPDLKGKFTNRNYLAWVTYFTILLKFLDDNNGNDYIPSIDKMYTEKIENTFKSDKTDLVSLVIEKMPILDNSTLWEKVVEFKSDPDNVGKFAGLKVWMNKAISSGASISEIKDELDYLLYQYRKSLELHKIKYHSGTLQRIVVGTAELIENAARLKFSNIAKGLFSAHQEKVDLLQAEFTAPGKEIAFIYQAQKTFG